MSLPPKEKDLVGILNDYERKIDDLEFLVSTQDFDTGAGIIGPQGPQGLSGPAGPAGQTGSQGPAGTISIGTVTTAPSGSSAAVTNIGTASAAILDFDIPRGEKGNTGNTGPQGSAASIAVGSVTTTASGTSASITNAGTSSAAIFNFSIPRGDKGDVGPQGAAGINGGGPSPIGAIVEYSGTTAPSDWLLCDGSAISRTTYADLFAIVGTTYGSGDGSTTFNIPNQADSIIAYATSQTGGGPTSAATSARVIFFA